MEEEKNGLNPEPGMAESVSDGIVSDSSTEEESVKAEERHPEPEQPPVTEDKQPEAPRMESVEPVRPAAESSQGPWQGGYGDTRDTASPPKRSGNGMSIAALVMGILSLVCCCCGYASIAFGALGIIFALLSRGEEPMNTQAKVGLVLSCIGIALAVISIIVLLIGNAGNLMEITTQISRR